VDVAEQGETHLCPLAIAPAGLSDEREGGLS
jgi:hypothetical protein